jgi:hypothetical protein
VDPVVRAGKNSRPLQLNVVGAGILVYSRSEFHAEALDAGFPAFVDQAEIERPFRNLKLGFHHLGRQQEGVPVVLEALL